MKFAHFFVDRPVFASVLSIILVILGGLAFFNLPVAEYPDIAPPTIVVRATYPGANADTVAATVATPLEQEVNGVEDMIYMSSFSTGDGSMALTITFKLGTDLDKAQVLVQNRVAIAVPRLPQEVQRLGVTTRKASPDLMMVVHMLSPDDSRDQLYVSNYAQSNIRDVLLRLDGIGDITLFGAREYSMRIWLDPQKMSAYGLAGGDIVAALQEQNVQVSGGALGTPPEAADNAFQITVSTQGRFEDIRQFRNVIVKATDNGRLVRLSDVARVELGAKDYVTNSYLNGKPAVALAIYQRPGSNALQAADDIIATMERLKKDFPPGLAYQVVYNPTEFISESVKEVYKTLYEALALVVLVVIVFLQNWRTVIIPLVAIPVSLIATFAVMAVFGFSLNTLSLFGLVLAIGIVVDDAIVVVENVERNIADGMKPRDAAHETMDQVGGAVIAIALVLTAVFVPTAFIPGISGQFYRQFALTIAASTIISAINSLTLSPALCALILRPHATGRPSRLPGLGLLRSAAGAFNTGFERASGLYGRLVGALTRRKLLMLAFYGLLAAATVVMINRVPTGFIPLLDRGYAIVVIQTPDGSSLARTDKVTQQAASIITQTPGVKDAVTFVGFSGATFTNAPNAAAIFARFDSYPDRLAKGLSADKLIGQLTGRLATIQDAFIFVVPPPAVRGIGNAGGFKLEVQDRGGVGLRGLLTATYDLMGRARANPKLTGVFTTFGANTPQIYLDIDRVKARMLNVPISNIFEALQVNLGSAYANDFNTLGRVYQVRVQADERFRMDRQDIPRLKVRSATGALVPLGTLVDIKDTAGPDLVQRYNLYTAVPLQGSAAHGVSSGEALQEMARLAAEGLPPGTGFEWTELAYQQQQSGNTAAYIFALSVLFVFLVLAAQYESWSLPLAIILIVPMGVLSAMIGISWRGLDNNILTQIGLVVLVGLAAKNAILIVEFARQIEATEGLSPVDAVVKSCRLRLRPILMTAFAFIFGVIPLVIASGPGAELRQAIGTAVFSGMIGVTFFGLVLTPVFYVTLREWLGHGARPRPAPAAASDGGPAAAAATNPAPTAP